MANTLTGKILYIYPPQQIPSKDGSKVITKRAIVIDCTRFDPYTGERGFENTPMLEFIGDRCAELDKVPSRTGSHHLIRCARHAIPKQGQRGADIHPCATLPHRTKADRTNVRADTTTGATYLSTAGTKRLSAATELFTAG